MAAFALPMLWFGGQTAVGLFTQDPVVIEIGASYLRVDAILFPIYMMLFSINSILQALKKPIWTLWISIYRQGLGVALFIWIFIGLLNFDVLGVWLGIAVAVSTGWLLSLLIAVRVGKSEIGGLLRAH
jgi:Na+-driven multidrug efflux pump